MIFLIALMAHIPTCTLQEIIQEVGLEELFMGLASQIAEREDSVLCSDVRGKPFSLPLSGH